MKTVLFAIKMDDTSSKTIEIFTNKITEALKTGNRDFSDVRSVYCNYKESLMSLCDQYKPECIVISEKLSGSGDVFDLISEVKAEYPSTHIVVLLTDERIVGDGGLSKLTMAGVYNWITPQWDVKTVANAIMFPKKKKDVEAYIPKISSSDGMAFEAKVVDRKEIENIEDISDMEIFENREPGTVKVNGVNDIQNEISTSQVAYTRVISGGFGFGKGTHKPTKITEKTEDAPVMENSVPEVIESKPEEQKPVNAVPDTVTESPAEDNDENMSFFEALERAREEIRRKKEEEEKAEALAMKAEQESKAAEITEAASVPETSSAPETVSAPEIHSVPDEFVIPHTDSTPVVQPPEIPQNIHTEQPAADIQNNTAEEKKPYKEKHAKKPPEIDAEQLRRELAEAERGGKPEDNRPTLSTIVFTPKYSKVLFVRAMPVASLLPVHICKLMNAEFVDFNKVSCNEGYFENMTKTTIKEAAMPDAERIVGDVVAGNGIENLVGKFDHVVAVLPEDPFAIKNFMERYGAYINGAVIDRAYPSAITRKQLLSLVPGKEYIDTVKTNECEKEVVQALFNHEFLMDNAGFAEGMKYFLKNLGGTE